MIVIYQPMEKKFKFLDKIEYNSQKFEIQKSSFLYILKDNIQNAKEDIFNKQIYILKNSIVNNNEKEFNITGELPFLLLLDSIMIFG